MIDKNDLLINTNGYVLSLLQKILDANIEVIGIENIPKKTIQKCLLQIILQEQKQCLFLILYTILQIKK